MKRIFFSFVIISMFTLSLLGEAPEKKNYHAARIITAPLIDGILNEPVWLQGEWLDDFTQYEPYNGRETTQRTEFKILFDENNLYVAIKALDTNPDSIVKRLTRRDEVDGDMVSIIFDSYHDLRTGFLFGVSAGGVKNDLMMTNDGLNEDLAWDPNWWVKTTINNEGWIAEMKIPFSQVRFEKSSGDIWGLQIVRVLYRKKETGYWQHLPKDSPGIVHLIGEMSGVKQIKPRKIFDVTPYVVAKTERYPAETGNPFATGKDSRINGGIDAKIGVTNNLTLDLTINPDFGQVEADPSVVNLTAYETFYEEKRPLFIEGNNITSFGIGIGGAAEGSDNLFYSRRIGRIPQGDPFLNDGEYSDIPKFTSILGAAKLTGKTKNGLSVGFLNAVTAEEKAEIDADGKRSFQTVEPLSNYLVARVQKDVNSGNMIIGGMVTMVNRDLKDIPLTGAPERNLINMLPGSAYTAGVDFTKYFSGKTYQLNVNTAFSQIRGTELAMVRSQEAPIRYFQRPGDKNFLDSSMTSLSGNGGRIQFSKDGKGHWNYIAAVTWKTPGFELNDIGFLREADNIIALLWGQYKVWEPKSFYRSYDIGGNQYTFRNFAGDRQYNGNNLVGNIIFKNYWKAEGFLEFNYNRISKMMLRGGPLIKLPRELETWYMVGTDQRKKLVLELKITNSTIFSDESKAIDISAILTYKPTNTLVLSLSPSYLKSFEELQYVDQTKFGNDNRYIMASIDQRVLSMSLRVNFNLTPDLTLQYWGQPFIASGKYYDFKYITDPMASEYHDRFKTYTSDQITLHDDGYYSIDEDRNGGEDYRFGKPDFNVQEFLSNLVLRWEYNPGSSVYLVWSQNLKSSNSSGDSNFNNNINALFSEKPYNVFLLKFSYRFGLR